MGHVFTNFLYVCGEIWRSIGVAQRVSIALVALLGASALGVVIYLGTRPNWQVLYSDLDQAAASEVYEIVRDEGVPAKLRSGGRTILVPYQHVNDLRLRIARNGVVVDRKGVGFELFDDVKLGLTDMQQRVGYQRAVQGELERMIRQLPGVDNAQVMLALPQRRVFQESTGDRAKASVLVALKPGYVLDEPSIAGIRHLVSSAVEGVAVEDVTIADSRGNLLARARASQGGDPLADSGSRMEIQERIEQSLREKAESILRPLVGTDAVVAIASVLLDFDTIETVKEEFDADNVVAVSERSETEEQSSSGRGPSGAPGVASNVVSVRDPQGTQGGGDSDEDTRKTTESEFIVPKSTEKVTIAGPRVRQLSVAVTIARRQDGKARAPEELRALEDLVRSAVGAVNAGSVVYPGLGAVRSDMVTVMESDFLGPPENPDGDVPSLAVSGGGVVDVWLERVLGSHLARPAMGVGLLVFLYYLFGTNFRRPIVESTDLSGTAMREPRAIDAEGEVIGDGSGSVPLDLILAQTQADPALVADKLEQWLLGDEP